MQVLAVDDSPIDLELLVNALRHMGHQVHSATNGREALEILTNESCRLVISDWQMPEMDGFELCRAIRGGSLSHYVYTILLTSHSEMSVAALNAGADDFLAKPFLPAELSARVRAGERVLSLDVQYVTILALSKLAESRDHTTGEHLERVAAYSQAIARHLSTRGHVNADFVRLIGIASPLHDIGKAGMPDEVLLKPTELSMEEQLVLQRHTTIGAITLENILKKHPEAKFLQMAKEIAAAHHEHYDGSGYPHGLTGDAIPLSARIVSVVDAYDSLTSNQVYQRALSHSAAKRLVSQHAGTLFDPWIVQAFNECETEVLLIREQHRDGTALELAPLKAHNSNRPRVADASMHTNDIVAV